MHFPWHHSFKVGRLLGRCASLYCNTLNRLVVNRQTDEGVAFGNQLIPFTSPRIPYPITIIRYEYYDLVDWVPTFYGAIWRQHRRTLIDGCYHKIWWGLTGRIWAVAWVEVGVRYIFTYTCIRVASPNGFVVFAWCDTPRITVVFAHVRDVTTIGRFAMTFNVRCTIIVHNLFFNAIGWKSVDAVGTFSACITTPWVINDWV